MMTYFTGKKIIITGANGGIGSLLCEQLAQQKAELILISQSEKELQQLCQKMKDRKAKSSYIAADFSNSESIQEIAAILSEMDDIDMIINLAGMMSFNALGLESHDKIEKIYHINVLAPIMLSKAILPEMVKNKSGHIVNIGSIFGSIAFPYFSLYSSSKAAIRAFSESLGRELDGSGVKVSYIAPRAVATKMNGGLISDYLHKTSTTIDDPEKVVDQILKVIQQEKKVSYFGFLEKIFVKLNYLFPSLISSGIQKQTNIAREMLIKK